MPTSNKILVSLLIAITALLAFTHASVYKKSKRNDVISNEVIKQKEEAEYYKTQIIKPFTRIQFENANQVTICYGKSFKVLYSKEDADKIIISQYGDLLSIKETNNEPYRFWGGSEKKIIVYCPNFNNIDLNKSSVTISEFNSNAMLDSSIFTLKNSELILGSRAYGKGNNNFVRKENFLNKVYIRLAEESDFYISNSTKVETLDLISLKKNTITVDHEQSVDSLKLNVSDSSRLNMPAILLKKI